jgi:hypothetical protein
MRKPTEIEITIDADGEIKSEVFNAVGGECQKLTDGIMKDLAGGAPVKETKKPEFFKRSEKPVKGQVKY